MNRGFRVQFNSAIGPYKGGLRFHPTVTESVVKFLGFEQILKNSLTTLPMGGGKGGSDFDPKGKSDAEVMRFCQSLHDRAVAATSASSPTFPPATSASVAVRSATCSASTSASATSTAGVLTGKGLYFGGSLARTEATGYGVCYYTQEALRVLRNDSFEGKTVVISGSGNVATYAAQKAEQLGAKVVTVLRLQRLHLRPERHQRRGRQADQGSRARPHQGIRRARCRAPTYHEGSKGVWTVKGDIALPCATQNEVDGESAQKLVDNGVTRGRRGCEHARPPRRPSRSTRRTACCTARPRLPTPVAWPSPPWR